MDETELLAAAQAGDEDAFAKLYRAHIGYVQAVGRSILRAEELDDLCQETFLLAFTRLHGFCGSAGFRTWITRIAINQCLLLMRRGRQGSNGDQQLVQMDLEEAEDKATFRTRDVYLESLPARMDMERLLQELLPMQRQAMELAYIEEMPDTEIAETLGIAVSKLSGLLHRGKRRLRKELSK